MKSFKTLVAAGAAAASLGMTALPANAAVEASVGASSLYLFRGLDAGSGDAAVFGDVTVSDGGFYMSMWASSANSLGGTNSGGEIDLLAGWSGEISEGLTLDIGAVNYIYPSTSTADSFGDLTEAYIGLGYGNFELYYYKNVADGSVEVDDSGSHEYEYYSLGYTQGAWSVVVGQAEGSDDTLVTSGPAVATTPENKYTHLDVTWAASDNLSFTVSKIVDIDDDLTPGAGNTASGSNTTIDDDTQIVVSYSLPVDIK